MLSAALFFCWWSVLNSSHLYIPISITHGGYCSLIGTVANLLSFPRTEGIPRTLSVLKLGKSQVHYSGFPFLVHYICLISIRDHHSTFPVFKCLKTTVSYIFFFLLLFLQEEAKLSLNYHNGWNGSPLF